MKKTHGLTLGKFAPLHQGHQLIIETALTEMNRVSVIIYNAPETTLIPLEVRAGWLRNLYPNVEVIEAWDGPSIVGNSPQVQKLHENYIINRLGITGITHFYSSEFYGDHVAKALGAVNRQVDSDRIKIPVSATAIRQDPYHFRKFVPPIVYRDMVLNVVFLGAPSTGKTTIAEKMANEFNTVWMPEYGREYWEAHQENRQLSLKQLDEIATTHVVREDAKLSEANRICFVDTNALTTRQFAISYHNQSTHTLDKFAENVLHRYDLFFLCDTDIPYDDTWDRSGDVKRKDFQKQIISDLKLRKVPYITLSGSQGKREKTVRDVVLRMKKFGTSIEDLIRGNNV